MAAPSGNKFWELRSKHGRDKLFATPKLLWKAACEYFEWCEANPFETIEFNGKDAIECTVPKMRVFTLTGLCSYLNCNTAYFRQFKKNLKETDNDFSTVITRIEETIYTNKFSGAAAGLLNANIISRDLGLMDKIDHTTNDKDLPAASQIINQIPVELLEQFEQYASDKQRNTSTS